MDEEHEVQQVIMPNALWPHFQQFLTDMGLETFGPVRFNDDEDLPTHFIRPTNMVLR